MSEANVSTDRLVADQATSGRAASRTDALEQTAFRPFATEGGGAAILWAVRPPIRASFSSQSRQRTGEHRAPLCVSLLEPPLRDLAASNR